MAEEFAVLTSDDEERHKPFRWQKRLLRRLLDADLPKAVDVPTGLGKTSVMALWLIALAEGVNLPRRLVYVVDRRAVVDQATRFAERLRRNMPTELADRLRLKDGAGALPISTLRGGFADNRDWLEDPSKPAIVVGTIDMIGSRLLFEGYGVSRGMRPYHAGLLGVDTLVVLDEAHLCPPFEALLRQVAAHRDGKLGPRSESESITPPFYLMSLSATGRDLAEMPPESVFRLEDQDQEEPEVHQRLTARKRLKMTELTDARALTKCIASRAIELGNGDTPFRVVAYCNSRKDAVEVKELIDKECKQRQKSGELAIGCESELLVGERRVYERTELEIWLDQNGFLGGAGALPRAPTFLVATSAGEVGVDLDADHMVCDLVAYERMVQRLGRVNRRGGEDRAATVDVFAVRPQEPKANAREGEKDKYEKDLETYSQRMAPMRQLPRGEDGRRDASPSAVVELKSNHPDVVNAATTRAPLYPELTRPLLDAWSMTSLDEHTGRPDVQPWLRGWVIDPPQTTIVWRKHLPVRGGVGAAAREVEAFFRASPPHISEKLAAETRSSVVDWLVRRASRVFASPVCTLEQEDIEASGAGPEARSSLQKQDVVGMALSPASRHRRTLTGEDFNDSHDNKTELERDLQGATLIVDARFCGLSGNGMLDPTSCCLPQVIDDGSEWLPSSSDKPPLVRFRVRSVTAQGDVEADGDWRERHRFETERTCDGEATQWLLVEKWRHDGETEQDRSAGHPQELAEHHAWTECKARTIAAVLRLPSCFADMLTVAARLHDEGKRHERWQSAFNAPRGDKVYAKTKGPINLKLLDHYRHEFGSLAFVEGDQGFKNLTPDLQDLALHLVAAHHGHARPVITTDGCDTPRYVAEERALKVALRFARMQTRWGPWVLAWWEALLRAADQQASRDNDDPDQRTNGRAAEENL